MGIGHDLKEAHEQPRRIGFLPPDIAGIGRKATIDGVGPDAPITQNENGGKQSSSPYRSDLLPASALLRVAAILKDGADKYGDHNWRKIPVRDHVNHAMTHLLACSAGDTSDDHLGHATTRLLFALDLVEGAFPSAD